MRPWTSLLYIQSGMLAAFVVFCFLSYSTMQERLNGIQESNHRIQSKIAESIDSLLVMAKSRPLRGSEVLQVATRELREAVALEHDERKAWLDHLNLFATIAIGLLALFAVFIPVVLQFSLQSDVKDLHEKVRTMEEKQEPLDTLSLTIQRIDLYRLQSSILYIAAPHSIELITTSPQRFLSMMRRAFREIKGKIDEIRSNQMAGVTSDGELRNLIQTSFEQFAFSLFTLRPLDVFASKPAYELLTNIGKSTFLLADDLNKKESWQRVSDDIEKLINSLDSMLEKEAALTQK